MDTKIKLLAVGFYALSLSSCMINEDQTSSNYRSYYAYDPAQMYAPGAYNDNYKMDNDNTYRPTQTVSVPDSYHVGEYHSPVSFKDRDRSWVSSQNPQSYTIEIADDAKASQVAQKLYKAPKNDRRAQVKYQRNGKAYYKGVYGSYNSAEEAQKALDALPAEIKQGAGVKNWSSVQGGLDN